MCDSALMRANACENEGAPPRPRALAPTRPRGYVQTLRCTAASAWKRGVQARGGAGASGRRRGDTQARRHTGAGS